jgi:TnpA family transposase
LVRISKLQRKRFSRLVLELLYNPGVTLSFFCRNKWLFSVNNINVSRQDMIRLARLSTEDLEQVRTCRYQYTRLGLAYQLSFVRLHHRLPSQEPLEIIDELLMYVSVQLNIPTPAIEPYLQQTRTIITHQQVICDHLQLRRFGATEVALLEVFLFDEACRLEQTGPLLVQAKTFLKENNILFPADDTLRRLIITKRQAAREHIYNRIANDLPVGLQEKLNTLLIASDNRLTLFNVLKQPPGQPSPKSMLRLDGTFSSSDGQRFAVAQKTNRAAPLPRYFGYGRGLTFYTWTSNQYSQYGTRVTPPTLRDATTVLDAILENETDLEIKEHTTDTAGYTDLIFALFDLLGLQFSPRLRDIGSRNLYCIDPAIEYKRIGLLLHHTIDIGLILDHWDELLRVTASLKMGWVTASTLVGKLQASTRQRRLTQAFQEYGRLVRTIFILHYLDDPDYRWRILVQLNKGENVHRLRRFLFFDNLGRIRKREPDELVNQAGCLNLMTNAIVVWNTVYMQTAIDALAARGHSFGGEALARLSPVRFEHINPYGRFEFEFRVALDSSGLRPLRSS